MNYRLKAVIMNDIKNGELSYIKAIELYGFSTEELDEWMARYNKGGLSGLKIRNLPKETV